MTTEKPIIVQSDMTLLVEVMNPLYKEASQYISSFSELIKSLEHFHTYQITTISLWNASSSGFSSDNIIEILQKYSKYPIPNNLISNIQNLMDRYGKIKIVKKDNVFYLESSDSKIMTEIAHSTSIKPFIKSRKSDTCLEIDPLSRGVIKMELIKIGFPVEDLAGYKKGTRLDINLRKTTLTNKPFNVRKYQQDAIDVFYSDGNFKDGSGVIVLPCGAGKTIVGIAALEKYKTNTLILTTNVISSRQWISEILDKTNLKENQVSEYNGTKKDISSITVATYQILTYRKSKEDSFKHFDLFMDQNWGFIIYDEVHLLPAPLFRLCANMQATRRMGLTATLVREDKKESDVFSLIGPKKFDVPWKDLEQDGWIATASCQEIRVPLASKDKMTYSTASIRDKIRVAACNYNKIKVIKKIFKKFKNDSILIIGQYIDQLEKIQAVLDKPLIVGNTPNSKREVLFKAFKERKENILIISKVGNFAIDLPNANVLIQVSGTFGSRQEEAQRLGRVLRPQEKNNVAHFFTLVTQNTREQDFAMNRQLFLIEQGYEYKINQELID